MKTDASHSTDDAVDAPASSETLRPFQAVTGFSFGSWSIEDYRRFTANEDWPKQDLTPEMVYNYICLDKLPTSRWHEPDRIAAFRAVLVDEARRLGYWLPSAQLLNTIVVLHDAVSIPGVDLRRILASYLLIFR